MRKNIFLFSLVSLVAVIFLFPGKSLAAFECHSASQGDYLGLYRVVFICPTQDDLTVLDGLYPGCIELGSRTPSGSDTVASCDFASKEEYANFRLEAAKLNGDLSKIKKIEAEISGRASSGGIPTSPVLPSSVR